MVQNQHATSEVDGLISLAREVLSIHPEPAADAEILVSWAETFFDIASNAVRAGAAPDIFSEESDRVYAVVADMFPPETANWPSWADPLMTAAAERARAAANILAAQTKVEMLRRRMAEHAAGEGASVQSAKAPPASDENAAKLRSEDTVSGRKRSRRILLAKLSGLSSPTTAAAAAEDDEDDGSAMPPVKRPKGKGRENGDLDALQPRFAGRPCDRCKDHSHECVFSNKSRCQRCSKDHRACRMDGKPLEEWLDVRNGGGPSAIPAPRSDAATTTSISTRAKTAAATATATTATTGVRRVQRGRRSESKTSEGPSNEQATAGPAPPLSTLPGGERTPAARVPSLRSGGPSTARAAGPSLPTSDSASARSHRDEGEPASLPPEQWRAEHFRTVRIMLLTRATLQLEMLKEYQEKEHVNTGNVYYGSDDEELDLILGKVEGLLKAARLKELSAELAA